MSPIHIAATWAAEEYERRTRIIAANGKVNVYWLLTAGRVSWHEVALKFNLNYSENRMDFQEPFEAEMRKRHLIKVLKNKMSAEKWVEKYG